MDVASRFTVIVSGAPGSGKTTLARPLAEELGLPLLRKDVIKEALGDALGAADYAASHRLGALSVQVLRALLLDVGFGVYDSPWREELDLPDLARAPGAKVEVFCDCPAPLRLERIRARSGTRHPVHFDLDLVGATDGSDVDDPTSRPLAGPWPLLRVDTSRSVDIPALAERVRRAAGTAPG